MAFEEVKARLVADPVPASVQYWQSLYWHRSNTNTGNRMRRPTQDEY